MKCPHCKKPCKGLMGLQGHIKKQHPEHFAKVRNGSPVDRVIKRPYVRRAQRRNHSPIAGVAFCPRCGCNLINVSVALEQL